MMSWSNPTGPLMFANRIGRLGQGPRHDQPDDPRHGGMGQTYSGDPSNRGTMDARQSQMAGHIAPNQYNPIQANPAGGVLKTLRDWRPAPMGMPIDNTGTALGHAANPMPLPPNYGIGTAPMGENAPHPGPMPMPPNYGIGTAPVGEGLPAGQGFAVGEPNPNGVLPGSSDNELFKMMQRYRAPRF